MDGNLENNTKMTSAIDDQDDDVFRENEDAQTNGNANGAEPEPEPNQEPKPNRELVPEPEWKKGRQIKPTKEELEYRKKNFKSANVSKDFNCYLTCTSCEASMKRIISTGDKVPHHPVLRVLFCKTCKTYYESEDFSMDEDGTDKYCRWCGAGCTLFCCSKCVYGFCTKCIRKHFGPEKVKSIQKDDNWLCLFCNPKPLWFLRGICYAAKLEAKKNRNKPKSLEKKEKKPFKIVINAEFFKEGEPGPSKVNDNEKPSKVNDNEKEAGIETPEPRPPSRESSIATVIFENEDVPPSNNNNDDVVGDQNNQENINIPASTPIPTPTPTPIPVDVTPQINGVKRKQREKDSGEEGKITKKKCRTASSAFLVKDSSESGIDNNSDDAMSDFTFRNKSSKRNLEGVYKITQNTSNLIDKVLEKRLDKLKYINTYPSLCRELSKAEQAVDCLLSHLTQIKQVIIHTKENLKDTSE